MNECVDGNTLTFDLYIFWSYKPVHWVAVRNINMVIRSDSRSVEKLLSNCRSGESHWRHRKSLPRVCAWRAEQLLLVLWVQGQLSSPCGSPFSVSLHATLWLFCLFVTFLHACRISSSLCVCSDERGVQRQYGTVSSGQEGWGRRATPLGRGFRQSPSFYLLLLYQHLISFFMFLLLWDRFCFVSQACL